MESERLGSASEDFLGRKLRDLRISVTDRCNFRCPYCMPAEIFGESYPFLPKKEILSFEEISRLANLFVALGVSKLRITGGEPLLRVELPRLIKTLAGLPGHPDLALTTNAYLLEANAEKLFSAGLRRITISLDGCDEETFQAMTGRHADLSRVLRGINAAEKVGFSPLKINCVVRKNVNQHVILPMAEKFRGTGHILRFIEFMDVGTRNGWDLSQVVTAKEIVECLDKAYGLEALEPNYTGEVARRYRYADGAGEIGIIASVTAPFCGDCSRARITADGRLVTCLFSEEGFDLKTFLRTGAEDEEILEKIAGVWGLRRDRYSEERTHLTNLGRSPRSKIEMFQVGG